MLASYLEDSHMWCTFLLILLNVDGSFLTRFSRIWHERFADFEVLCIRCPVNQMLYLFFNTAAIILVTSSVLMFLCGNKVYWFLLPADYLVFFIWKAVYFLSLSNFRNFNTWLWEIYWTCKSRIEAVHSFHWHEVGSCRHGTYGLKLCWVVL